MGSQTSTKLKARSLVQNEYVTYRVYYARCALLQAASVFAQPTSRELIYHKCGSLFDNFDDTTHQRVISVCLWKVQACLEKSGFCQNEGVFFLNSYTFSTTSFDLRFCAILATKHEVGFDPHISVDIHGTAAI